MAKQAVEQFVEMIKQNSALQEAVQKEMLAAGSAEAALAKAAAIAAQKGLHFSGDELKTSLPLIGANSSSDALSDAQLEPVAGGTWAQRTIGSTTIWCYICAMGTSGA